MSKLPKNMDVDLRRLFPDVALQMDTQVILHQARELGIHPHVNRSVKLPVLRVPLTLDHEISISPVDKGAMGIAEWFTFARPCECPKDHPEVISRVHVSVTDKMFQQSTAESFTIEAPNFEMMMRISLTIYYTITGKKLQPIVRTNGKNSGGNK
jgi:hypothetical protein